MRLFRPSTVVRLVILTMSTCRLEGAVGPVLAWPRQSPPAATGVTGAVTALEQKVPMAGVVVQLVNAQGGQVAVATTDDTGSFRLDAPGPGAYRLKIDVQGFGAVDRPLVLVSGTRLTLNIELRLAATYAIEVRPKTNFAIDITRPENPGNTIDGRWLSASAMSVGSVAAGLRWMSGVTPYGREWAIKGGRPNQIGLEVDAARVVDPAAGTSPVQIPADSVETIQVLANPYAVEFGGFSSGVILISTRQPARKWTAAVNNFLPGFRLKRNSHPFAIKGIESADPRFTVSGPIVRDRFFVSESAQYRYDSADVYSRPPDQRRVSQSFSSFTRADLTTASGHVFSGIFAAAPENTSGATLSTFDPPEVTADLKQRSYRAGLIGTSPMPHGLVMESLVDVIRYRTSVDGHGAATAMTLAPEGNSGIYYGRQERQSTTFQAKASLSGVIDDVSGHHVIKGGFDVMRTDYSGAIDDRPIDVLREDGTRTLRLDMLPGPLGFAATDVSAFLQDRWLLNARTTLDVGTRFERDGVFGRVNVVPRIGGAFVVNQARRATIRGGWGYFLERTPTIIGAFDQQAGRSEQAYASDGVTPLGPPVFFRYDFRNPLETPRSSTWNLSFEEDATPWLSMRFNYLHRAGRRELIVDSLRNGTDGRIVLSSTGTSRYRDIEVGAHLRRGPKFDLDLSCTHSETLADLNPAYDYFLAMTASPVVRPDVYGPTAIDVPHRFVARGHAQFGENWMFEGVVGIASGPPYSALDEQLNYSGQPNSRRFPIRKALDVSVERRFRIGKFDPWIGFVFINAFNTFNPIEVQANIASPSFGSFYNSRIREIRLLARFRR